MKNVTTKLSLALCLLALGVTSTTMVSCDKKESIITEPVGNEPKLKLNVSGIVENLGAQLPGIDKQAAVKGSPKAGAQTLQNLKTIEQDGFDVIPQIEYGNGTALNKLAESTPGGSSNLTDTLATGTKYKFFLFDGNTLVNTSNDEFAIGGTNNTLDVTLGKTYTWVALSYNSSDAIGTVDPTANNFALPSNKDVLYAKGTITIPSVATEIEPLAIPFERKYNRITLELNTMGMFSDLNSAAVTVSGIDVSSTTIDLTTGTLGTSLTSHTAPAVNFASFISKATVGTLNQSTAYTYHDQRQYTYYTANNSAQAVSITVDDPTVKPYNSSSVRAFNISPITTAYTVDPTAAAGKSDRLLFNLVESGITIGNRTWARANIMYEYTKAQYNASGTVLHNPYRFEVQSGILNDLRYFWPAQSPLPFSTTNPGNLAIIDPCYHVYPTNTWRTPTYAEFSALDDVANSRKSASTSLLTSGLSLGTIKIVNTFQNTATAAADAPYQSSKVLTFTNNGFGPNISLLDDFLTVTFNPTGPFGLYWTPLSVINVSPLASVGNNAIAFTTSLFGAGTEPSLLPYAELLDINIPGLSLGGLLPVGSLASTNLYNVRCIRR